MSRWINTYTVISFALISMVIANEFYDNPYLFFGISLILLFFAIRNFMKELNNQE